MTPEQRAANIGYCTCANIAGAHDTYCISTQIAAAIRAATNEQDKEIARLREQLRVVLDTLDGMDTMHEIKQPPELGD